MGGTNDPSNLVCLTAREHYLVHWLLFKIHRNPPMAFAWHRMTFGRTDVSRYTSHTYVYARRARREAVSKQFTGRKLSEAHRKKLSEAKLGKTYADLGRAASTSLKGRSISELHRQRISEGGKGRRLSAEGRRNLSKAVTGAANHRFGKRTTDEVREKLSVAAKNAARGRETAVWLTIDGESLTVADWGRHPACQVKTGTISSRLAKGWEAEDAVFVPPQSTRKWRPEQLPAIRAIYRAKRKALEQQRETA